MHIFNKLPNIRFTVICSYTETNMLHFWHSKICSNLIFIALLIYIATDSDCDSGTALKIATITSMVAALIMGLLYCQTLALIYR